MSDLRAVAEIHALSGLVLDLIDLARSMADERPGHEPMRVNLSVDKALRLGVPIQPDPDTKQMYARDAEGGCWDSKLRRFVTSKRTG